MIKKYICFILVFLTILTSLSSAEFNLNIEKIDKGAVIISELNNPAVYDFEITNNGVAEMAEIYSLVGVSMSPKGTFLIPSGTSIVEVKAYPGEDFRKVNGIYNFEYQIRGLQSGIFKDKLAFRVVSLEDAISINDLDIAPGESKAFIAVKNNVNTNLENVNLKFSSSFFNSEKIVNLLPFEESIIDIDIELDKTSRLMAGQYPMKISVDVEEAHVNFKANIFYLKKEGVSVVKKSSGLIIRHLSITKTNKGNTPITADIEIKKDVFSRLFTSFSIEPINHERSGLSVKYSWARDIGPNESFTISSATNYTFPFMIIILIAIVGFLVKIYSITPLALNKRVSYVKTKGGEFALKVIINIKSRKHVDNIQIIDRLPTMTKLYEKYGRQPDRIDEASKRIFWNIQRLNKGEERIFSYIIYSKVRAMGRFELPSALAIFEKDGKQFEVVSNKAYFVTETSED